MVNENEENPWSFGQGRVLGLPGGQLALRSGIRGLERDQSMEDLADMESSSDSSELFKDDADPVLHVDQWELRSGGILNMPFPNVPRQQSLHDVVMKAVDKELANDGNKNVLNDDSKWNVVQAAFHPLDDIMQSLDDNNETQMDMDTTSIDSLDLFGEDGKATSNEVNIINPPLPEGWTKKFDTRLGKYYYIDHKTKWTTWEAPTLSNRVGFNKEEAKNDDAPLPEGWTKNLDIRTGKYYYIDHKTRRTTWEHPGQDTNRLRSHDLGRNKSASPVHPTPKPQMPQMGTTYNSTFSHLHGGAVASPSPITRLNLEELSTHWSPQSTRSTLRRDSHLLADIGEDGEQEQAISQIAAMFPTVDEAHIRELYKKYLKSVFPTVEEYLLLDVLANSENNVQKAADRLAKMGYVKRETPSAPRLHAKKKEEERLASKRTPLPKPPPIKTDKEKEDLRKKLKDKYEKKYDIPERILFMALESVLYDEEQAINLIASMIEDDLKRKKAKEVEKAKEKAERKKSPKAPRRIVEEPKHTSPKHDPKKIGQPSKKHNKTAKINTMPRISRGTWTQEGREYQAMEYRSQFKTIAKGPNANLRKGPNDDLLLTDYITWNGPNPDLRKGANASLVKGPERQSATGPRSLAKGPNASLAKGPAGLAKGAMYSKGPAGLAKGPRYNTLEGEQQNRSN